MVSLHRRKGPASTQSSCNRSGEHPRHTCFPLGKHHIANVKNSLMAEPRAVGAKHRRAISGAFAGRFNRRFVLKTIHERLALAEQQPTQCPTVS